MSGEKKPNPRKCPFCGIKPTVVPMQGRDRKFEGWYVEHETNGCIVGPRPGTGASHRIIHADVWSGRQHIEAARNEGKS